LLRRLPERFSSPTPDYAAQKALKEVTTRVFMRLDRIGVHLLPKHFYTPIPDYAWLSENRSHWDGRAQMSGVHWDLDEQMGWLAGICSPWLSEVQGLEAIAGFSRGGYGPGFGPIDAQVLHCFMRAHRPARVIEIGSGVSTAVIIAASRANDRDHLGTSRITCVDPFPTDALRRTGEVEIIADYAQRVPIELFNRLRDGDLLFIDSSHSVKVGSEVVRLVLEVIPRLPKGVTIHIHDVSLPYLYPRTALSDYFGWQETALLLALMTGNPALRTLASLSALHYDRTDALQDLLPDYLPQQNDAGLRSGDWVNAHFPDSFWIQVT
jgi:hypothetical protein